MYKSVTLLVITLSLLPAAAQQKTESSCRFRFFVTERTAVEHAGTWPEDARTWWDGDGKKKFPELCETTSHDANFVIAWLRKRSRETYSRPKSADSFSAFPANDCYTIPGETTCYPTGPDGQVTCYTSPPQTICTPQPVRSTEWEVEEREVERVSVAVCRIRDDGFEPLASLIKTGYSPSDRPGKAAFTRVIKAIKKKGTKPQARTSLVCEPKNARKWLNEGSSWIY